MSKSVIVKWFLESLIGLAGGLVLLTVAGALALANDVFIMDGPDVVGVKSGALAWTLLGLCGLAMLVIISAALAQFVAWIGAVLNTASLPSKTWFVVLLVVGLLNLVFIANLVYVIAGPDGARVVPSSEVPPLARTPNGYQDAAPTARRAHVGASAGQGN